MLRAASGGHDLTADFLTQALAGHLDGGTVTEVDSAPVGTGQVSDSFRLRLTYDSPAALPLTMIAKVPAAAPASRNAARAFRTYEIEASFYGQLAARLPVSLPCCYYAGYEAEPDEYIVLLEDLAPAQPGDQLAGISVDDAAAAIEELAALHAAGWGSPELAALPWLNRSTPEAATLLAGVLLDLYPGFRERYASQVEPGTLALIEDFLPRAPGYLGGADYQPRTIVHGDFRADNLLFGGLRPVVLDWQTCSYGAAANDLAYFLASSLLVPDRQHHEEGLVRTYHHALTACGVQLSWADCWAGYRRHAFGGIVMDIVAAMVVEQTERGDEMFAAMASRHARHAIDVDALALLE
ncbi:MAG TPA: phosphotransferase [Streptosporangiaceae bacterium]|nr:phosphotransferase [Streptosporangiaceae bacterium]